MKYLIRIALGAALAFGVAVAIACGGGDDASPSAVNVAEEHQEAVDPEHAADAPAEAADSHEPAVYEEDDGTLEYHIRVEGFAFEPNQIEVKKGQTVRIVLDNHDPVLHDYSVDDSDFVVIDSKGTAHHHEEAVEEQHQEGEELVSLSPLHVAAESGEHAILVFRADEAGTYQFYCSVPGHREAGMVGTLRVVE